MRNVFGIFLLCCVSILNAQTNFTLPKQIQSWIDKELAKAPNKTLIKDHNKDNFFAPKTSRVVGYLKGYNTNDNYTTGMIYTANQLTREDNPTVLKVNKDGTFEADFLLQHPQINSISIDDVWIPFYLEPGQTVAVIIDKEEQSKKKLEKGYYSYLGTTAKINNELAGIDFYRTPYEELMNAVKTIKPTDYKNTTLDKWKETKKGLLKSLNDKKVSPATHKIALAKQDVVFANNLFDYAMYRKYEENDTANKIAKIPTEASFFNFINDFDLNNKELFIVDEFSTFLNRLEFAEPLFRVNNMVSYDMPVNEKEVRLNQLTDSVFYTLAPQKNNLILQTIHLRAVPFTLRFILGKNSDTVRNNYVENLKVIFKDPFFSSELGRLAIADNNRNNNIGTDLPDTKAAQIFNNIISKYKGKRVYVDFWATTCGPCVGSIKHQYNLREKMNNKPEFDFVFITSEDESPKEDYEKFVQEQKLTNTYYLKISDYHYLRELFKFNGIPRYVVINEDGKLIDDYFQMHNIKTELAEKYPQYKEVLMTDTK